MNEIKQWTVNRLYCKDSLVLQNRLLTQYNRLKQILIYDPNEYIDYTILPNKFYLICIFKAGNEYCGIVNYIAWRKV